jgi:PadR family transcriptional regulator PadR
MPPLPKDLVAASATPLVLAILKRGDSYGYAIIQDVHTLSDGDMAWADGMLYPILHRLEAKGWVKSYWGEAESGRKRKYYRLMKAGAQALDEQRRNWSSIQTLFERLAVAIVAVASCSI